MKALVLIAVLVTSAFMSSAQAEFIYETGNTLQADCQSTENVKFGRCLGYILAVADIISSDPSSGKKGNSDGIRACFREGIVAGQLSDVVLKWLKENPQSRDFTGAFIVEIALAKAFPC